VTAIIAVTIGATIAHAYEAKTTVW